MIANSDLFPLRGLCVGISISAGDSGIPDGENADTFVNRLSFETGSHYLSLGASIALGHMWRPDGVMQHLARRASEFRHSFVETSSPGRRATIINRIAWPDALPIFDHDQADQLADILDAREVLPPGILTEGLDLSSRLGQYARIRALTAMRHELVQESDFRICMGGAASNPMRRLPGVIEEALLTYRLSKPLYLAAAFGGVTKALCDVILHRPAINIEEAFRTPSDAIALFQEFQRDYPCDAFGGPSQPNSAFDALSYAKSISIAKLATQAHLSEDDLLTLMTTPDIERAMQLIGLGISSSRKLPSDANSVM